MRTVLALLLLVHGIAHLPGFLVSWHLGSFPEMPFRTTVFGGTVDVGNAGIKAIGVAWLVAALAFAAGAAGVVMRAPWWQPVAYTTVVGSLFLTVTGWPEARFGLLANALVVMVIALGRRFGAL